MSRNYPNISGKEKLAKGTCDLCKREFEHGYKVTTETSWFRGEDDIDPMCGPCFKDYESKIDALDEKRWERERRAAGKQADFMEGLFHRLREKYTVKALTEYQWRINGQLDVYPGSFRYFNLKTKEWGHYRDVFQLAQKILN